MTLGGLSGYQAHSRTLRDVSSCSRHFGSISPSAQHAVDTLCLASLLHRWCTRLPATGPTPSGSTPCWTLRKCKVAGAKPTPKTKSSEWGCKGRGQAMCLGRGLKGLFPKLLAPIASCVLHAAPSSQSSSGQSTRCWRLYTSFPAVMMMGSPPKTSARCEGPLFPHPQHTEA